MSYLPKGRYVGTDHVVYVDEISSPEPGSAYFQFVLHHGNGRTQTCVMSNESFYECLTRMIRVAMPGSMDGVVH